MLKHLAYQSCSSKYARRYRGADRYRDWSSAAVPLKTERPIPASIEKGSGMLPNAPAPTVITFKIGEAYLTS